MSDGYVLCRVDEASSCFFAYEISEAFKVQQCNDMCVNIGRI
jgi:hypothetical protein